MKIVLTGVPGVGKTSVAIGLEKKYGWEHINFGDFMLQLAREHYGIKDRDEMRKKIPAKTYKRLQLEAARRIANMKGKIVVDTHCSIKKPEGYYPGLPMDILLALKPDLLVIIEADPEDIKKRREKDAAIRKRDNDPKEHQEINRFYAAAYSAIAGVPVAFVQNKEGKLEETIEEVKKIASRL